MLRLIHRSLKVKVQPRARTAVTHASEPAMRIPLPDSRRSGKPCCNGVMNNGRCRMHGGKATGAPKGNRNDVEAWELLKAGAHIRGKVRLLQST
jgi:hypothetical protein